MKMIDRIKDRGNLTPTENEIVRYIRESPEKAVNMSLDELASTIYVSKSTIIRFCKKLGFHGHKELCVELAKELNSLGADDIEVNVSMPFSKKDTPMEAARKMMQLSCKAINDTYSGIAMGPLTELASLIHEGRPFSVYAYGENYLPALDISNRPFLVFNAAFAQERCGDYETCVTEEFWRAFAMNSGITLHINVPYGSNAHHQIEAIFKAVAHALKIAVTPSGSDAVLSTKGVL
jgi:DNA-binding MurR/RpiR family transcriptional regulator